MRILGAVVPPLVAAVFDAWYDFSSRRAVALKLIGDDQSGYVLQPLQQLAEERLGCSCISAPLYEDIQYLAILVHCPP